MINAVTLNPYITNLPPANKNRHRYMRLQNDSVTFGAGNILSLSSEAVSKLSANSIKSENIIGQGREGIVYRIPDSEYCIKLIKKNPFIMKDFGIWRKTDSIVDKVNHVVLRASNGAYIMKFIEGTNIFRYKNPAEISALPKSSYKKLIKQVIEAEKVNMCFDNVPANIIYNSKEKSLTAIDFYQNDTGFGYPISKIYYSLTAPNTYEGHIAANKKIAGKLMQIILDEYGQNASGGIVVNDEDVTRLIKIIKRNYKQTLPAQYDFLEKTFYDLMDLKKAQRRGEDVMREINGKIKYADCIIKQILIME